MESFLGKSSNSGHSREAANFEARHHSFEEEEQEKVSRVFDSHKQYKTPNNDDSNTDQTDESFRRIRSLGPIQIDRKSS